MTQIKRALFKGIGVYPTHYAIRWSPSFKNPFNLDLIELQRCQTDGVLLSCKNNSEALLSLHAGHQLKDPVTFSLWEFFLVQIRWIK